MTATNRNPVTIGRLVSHCVTSKAIKTVTPTRHRKSNVDAALTLWSAKERNEGDPHQPIRADAAPTANKIPTPPGGFFSKSFIAPPKTLHLVYVSASTLV
jgi:hypothetical protein